MFFNINANSLAVDENALERIKAHLSKFSKYLPHLEEKLHMEVMIRKTHEKFHPKIRIKNKKAYFDTKLKQAKYEGWLKLILPKKVLYTKFEGMTVFGSINRGARNLMKEVKRYKELHFKSQSKYPNHETIRRATYE